MSLILTWAGIAQAAPEIEIDRIENNSIYFKSAGGSTDSSPLNLGLFDLKYIGKLRPAPGGEPYFLVSARPCRDCAQDISIYAVSPTRGTKPYKYVYPGKIIDSKSRSVVHESRAFFGRCLSSRHGDVYVLFQKERIDRKKNLQQSVFIAEPKTGHDDLPNGVKGSSQLNDRLHETLLEKHLPRFNDTQHLLKSGACREIQGRNRMTSAKVLDIRALRKKAQEGQDGADDDADETPRENQTDRDFDPK